MRFGKSHLWLFLSTLIWSGSTIFVKVSVQSGPPMHMAALRFTFGALILLPTLALSGWPRSLSRTDWREIGLMGILGIFFYNLCFFYSLSYTSAAENALIMSASPVAHFIVAAAVERERLTPSKAVGIATSVLGIVLVVLGGHGAPAGQAPNRLLGDGLMVFGIFFWAINSLMGKRLGRRLSPQATNALPVTVAGLIYLALTLPTGLLQTARTLPLSAWGALAYLVIASTIVGRLLWFAGLKGVQVSEAGVFFNIMPIWSTLLAALFLGEQVGLLQILGGLMVVSGVFLTTSQA